MGDGSAAGGERGKGLPWYLVGKYLSWGVAEALSHNHRPMAKIVAPEAIRVGEDVRCMAVASYDPDGVILLYITSGTLGTVIAIQG